MKIIFPISKFLARGLMCAAIFAGGASVVRGQYSGSSSAWTTAQVGDGNDAVDSSALFSSSVSFGKIAVDSVWNDDGTTTITYEAVDAEAEALARWTEHSVAVAAKADVHNSTDQSSGDAYAYANASLNTQVHIHSLPGGGSGHWQLAVHSVLSGVGPSATISGIITTYDDTGMEVAEQSLGTGLNAIDNHGDGTNYLNVESPVLYDGYTITIELGAQAQAIATQVDSDEDADLGDTVWLQFVADDPSTLSAVNDDGWDFSTPYSRVPAPAIAPIITSFAFTSNQFQLLVVGTFTSNYIVQAAADLNSTNWIPLLTNSAPFLFTESNANCYAQRFYRGMVAP
jgi:hypothetical protein